MPDVEVPGVPGLPSGDGGDEGERESEALDEDGPLGHACEEIEGEGGILFCPTGSIEDHSETDEVETDERVPSFDGAPLDVDVTLPPGFDLEEPEATPTIVIMHGYGGNKEDFESESEDGKRAEDDRDFHYNNVHYARQGYVVVNYSARGFGRSCGRTEESNETEACRETRSYVHLIDQRWEIRDTQYVLGLLADQGFTEPKEIGVTGISYGGGQSVILAFLRDEIRVGALAGEDDDPDSDSDSDFVPWRSPGPDLDDNDSDDDGEKPMEIAAAFPRWPWSDLVASLVPNGRFRQDRISDDRESRDPPGVPIATFITGLLGLGAESGTYCGTPPRTPPDDPQDNDPKYEDPDPGPGVDKYPACRDFTSDLLQAFQEVVVEGEPYDGDPVVEALADELAERHSGYALADRKPAPLLLQSGWTDDLFPPRESLRVYNKVRADHPDVPVSLQFGDVGHPRASNKEETDQDFNDEGSDFFDEHVMGEGNGPARGSARAWTQTCPADAEPEGPFSASSFDALHPRTASFGSDAPQTVQSTVASPDSLAYDPIADMQNPCAQTVDAPPPGGGDGGKAGTAVYRSPAASEGFRMLGLPTVTADIATTGNVPESGVAGQLDSRLFDVAPNGSQVLVSRGAYRLTENETGEVKFHLSGNGWCFESGHRAKLELLGQDAPYLRPSNGPTTTTVVSNLDVDLPGGQETCGPGGGSGGDGSSDDNGNEDGGSSGGGSGRGGNSGGGDSGGGDSGAPSTGGPPLGPPSTVACLVARLGGPGPDRVFGTAGGDSIQGLGGADRLFGLAGADCLFGGAGDDRLSGGPGDDRLSGAAGNDVLRGGPGVNAFSGGVGDDRLYARDGAAQSVFCGAGEDSAWVDAGDTPRGCERVLRPRR